QAQLVVAIQQPARLHKILDPVTHLVGNAGEVSNRSGNRIVSCKPPTRLNVVLTTGGHVAIAEQVGTQGVDLLARVGVGDAAGKFGLLVEKSEVLDPIRLTEEWNI